MSAWEKERVKKWRKRTRKSVEQLLTATGIDSRTISIETLSYPLEWVDQILSDFNLSVCIDIGHLMINRFDVEKVFDTYADRATIIHLHGVENEKDHLSLDRLSKVSMDRVIRILKRFTGIVSLEVFSYQHLIASLKVLEKCWR